MQGKNLYQCWILWRKYELKLRISGKNFVIVALKMAIYWPLSKNRVKYEMPVHFLQNR